MGYQQEANPRNLYSLVRGNNLGWGALESSYLAGRRSHGRPRLTSVLTLPAKQGNQQGTGCAGASEVVDVAERRRLLVGDDVLIGV